MPAGSYQLTNTSTATSRTGDISASGPVLNFYGKQKGIDLQAVALIAAAALAVYLLTKKR